MNSSKTNPELQLAWNFVEKTDRSIFLTGKAGTGKTTFLHRIKEESLKRLIVVAPTGVAAINARGVTIHSFFQLPFGPIIPDGSQFQQRGNYKMKISRQKIDIMRSLDLLIIDEISMVRADLLDAIDAVLRRYKDRAKAFGGVQVLMIGDLQQLSPVVKHNEWNLLKPHYDTAFFFSSKAFQQVNAVGIELKHIYRQDNEKFIGILNEIRNNNLTEKSATSLNKRFIPDFDPQKEEGFITLTTHNNRAKRINEIELNKNKSKSFFYQAKVKGKFSEHSFPTHENLELKKGAQVMFIKNDSDPEKRYFNGKIGTIIHLDKEEITVQCPEDEYPIIATPETWENVKYSIKEDTKEITEDFVGSFTQMPFRLAWAITIHKSQGLTFDKVMIDAEASFAHGQTYVALSRCKTLEGIVLKNKISSNSIISDHRVNDFIKNVEDSPPTESELQESEKQYQLNLIEELFNYHAFLYPVRRCVDIYYKNQNSIEGMTIEPLLNIKDNGVVALLKISTGFKKQLQELTKEIDTPLKDNQIQERISKAIDYFKKHTITHLQTPLEKLVFSTENKEIEKNLNKQLETIEELLKVKTHCLNGLIDGFEVKKYLDLRAKAVLQKPKTKRKKKKPEDTTEHQVLFEQLRELRHVICHAEDIPPFQVFTQKTLYEMCRFLPVTPKQLKAIHGMGKIRVEKYGDEIIEVIKEYVEKYDVNSKEIQKKKLKPLKGSSQIETFNLFKSGMPVSEIAKNRGFVVGTIESHLSQFIKSGELNITELMPEKKYKKIKKIMTETEFEGLSEVKAKLGDAFTYGELRMALNALEFEKKNS